MLSFTLQKSKKEKLLQEQTELEQNLEDVRQSLCGLHKSVSIESGSDQDHLQLLAKLTSPDSQITIKMVSCSSESDPSGLPVETVQIATPQASTQTEEAESSTPQSCPVSSSLLNACLEINNSL